MTKIQRYKVGFFSDEWGMSSITPCLIPDDSGFAVKFEDYCKLETELAALKAELEEENTALVKTIQRDTLTSLRRLAELKALKAELREICAAIDDPAGDLTLTAVECIKKLKAENEWQPIETAPKGVNGYAWMLLAWGPEDDQSTGIGMLDGEEFYAVGTFYCLAQVKRFEFREIKVNPTHWMPLPKPPAMPQGENGKEMK